MYFCGTELLPHRDVPWLQPCPQRQDTSESKEIPKQLPSAQCEKQRESKYVEGKERTWKGVNEGAVSVPTPPLHRRVPWETLSRSDLHMGSLQAAASWVRGTHHETDGSPRVAVPQMTSPWAGRPASGTQPFPSTAKECHKGQ